MNYSFLDIYRENVSDDYYSFNEETGRLVETYQDRKGYLWNKQVVLDFGRQAYTIF